MNRKDEWTESEQRLKQYMINEMEADDDLTGAKLDLSFLPPDEEKTATRKKKLFRPAAVAALLIAILSVSLGMAIWISSQPAQAFFDSIRRYWRTDEHNLVVTSDPDEEASRQRSFEFHSLAEMEKARAYVAELLIPAFAPDGYELEIATLQLYDEDYRYTYTFADEEERSIEISCFNIDENYKMMIFDSKLYYEEDLEIALNYDPIDEKFSASAIYAGQSIRVTGTDLDEEDLIEIVLSLGNKHNTNL